jgi:hypothetical protein
MDIYETWRSIPDSEYYASNIGRIRSPRGTILKPYTDALGYSRVSIRFEGLKGSTYYVHRLVAMAFHGKPGGQLDVAHNNGQRSDNRSENLRWATRSDNCNDFAEKIERHPFRSIEVGESFTASLTRAFFPIYVKNRARKFGREFQCVANDGSWTVTRVA